MSYPINYPTPQGANVQIFTAPSRYLNSVNNLSWIKPQGASFVWFTLIGAGGTGTSGTFTGGGSGAVTNFMCPAFLIPNELGVRVGGGTSGATTTILYQEKNTAGYTLLTAASGSGSTGGSAMSANAFTAMGFFQSIAGQNGANGAVSASSTTFLSGGGSNSQNVTANYGYTNNSSTNNIKGFFQMQPIIVGTGGMGSGIGGTGCGGGTTGTVDGNGGDGLVVIITW